MILSLASLIKSVPSRLLGYVIDVYFEQATQAFLLKKQLREHISSQLHAMREAELARWRTPPLS